MGGEWVKLHNKNNKFRWKAEFLIVIGWRDAGSDISPVEHSPLVHDDTKTFPKELLRPLKILSENPCRTTVIKSVGEHDLADEP